MEHEILLIEQENEQLREENERLQREVELEEKISARWEAVAGIFKDELWKALIKYDPEQYLEKKGMFYGEAEHARRPVAEGE